LAAPLKDVFVSMTAGILTQTYGYRLLNRLYMIGKSLVSRLQDSRGHFWTHLAPEGNKTVVERLDNPDLMHPSAPYQQHDAKKGNP